MSVPTRRTANDALALIAGIALASFVIATLYIARDILIPLTLAALLTFLLAPLVTRLERWVGRIVAVLIVVAVIFAATVGGGWGLTRQWWHRPRLARRRLACRLPPAARPRHQRPLSPRTNMARNPHARPRWI